MIKIENIEVFNFEGAFRGLRNPMNSWDKSDSYWTGIQEDVYNQNFIPSEYIIGPNDLKLAQRMIKAGTDESKFMRQIFVSMDIEAPLYWWKEMDTYKVATVANSCSTMHKITSGEITEENYSFDPEPDKKLTDLPTDDYIRILNIKQRAIEDVEWLRKKYKETGDKRYWRLLIQANPDGWLQKRTWTGNYQNLRNMYFARKNHKLIEWREFCQMIENLPYSKELICYKKEINNG